MYLNSLSLSLHHFSLMKLPLLLLLLATSSVHSQIPPSSAAYSPCHFPAIFNFGDSNSDTGGLSAAFATISWPYGETFFNALSGRYSDGRLIIDFAAESLGLPYMSAYLNSVGTNFSHGANFATSLATISPQSSTLPLGAYSPFSLHVQLQQFSQFTFRSQVVQEQGGALGHLMPKKDYFSRALYMFDVGQNDLTALYFSNISADSYLSSALQEFSTVVKGVYERGGRSFWIHNTGPLGCLPYALVPVRRTAAGRLLDQLGCSVELNQLAKRFNAELNETVSRLRADLPLASLVLTDVYSVKYSLIGRAGELGFDRRSLRACCGHGGGAYNFDSSAWCGQTAEEKGKQVLLGKPCRNPAKSVIWDGAHYTEAANRWVFDQISGGAFSQPPLPLAMACRRRRRKAPPETIAAAPP